MKKISLFVVVLALTTLSTRAQYYYSYEKKIPLNPTNFVIVPNNFSVSPDSLAKEFDAVVIYTNTLYSVLECKDTKDLRNQHYPVYQLPDGELVGHLDEMVFSLKKNVSLDYVLQSFPIEVVKTTSCYILAKLSNQEADALSISNQLQESGLVIFSHPNFIANVQPFDNFPDDPFFNHQFYLNNYGQQTNDGHFATSGADIRVLNAWNITKGDSSVIVAVIDEGVTSNHPDLPNNRQVRLSGSNFASTYDNSDINDPSPVENDNHGNACAGIIGATHNSEGIAGIAPFCKIMPIRIPYGFIPAETYAAAIEFATNNGADILSNSWGYGSSTPDLFPVIVEAINHATDQGRSGRGCLVSFAAGNTADRIRNYNGFVTFPASCNNSLLIVVGASDRDDKIAAYSPMGNKISVVAPSHKAYKQQVETENLEVWSIDIPGIAGYNPDNQNETGEFLPSSGVNYLAYTGRFGGTSAACPQVSGTMALMLSVNPNLTNQQASRILKKTTRKVPGYIFSNDNQHPCGSWNIDMGYGVINAGAAVQMAYDLRNVGDLYVKDNLEDTGAEPNTTTSVYTNAPEIRIVKDGQEVTTIKAGETYEVRITVRNCDSRSTPAGKKVRLNWSRVSNSMPWNSAWRSLPQYPWNPWSSVRGGYIGQCELPLIYAGGFYEASVTWTVPTLNDIVAYPFGDFNWSCALLARIEDGYVTEGENFTNYDITPFVANNNNVARKNITILQENHEPLVAALEYVRDIDGQFPIRLQYKSKPNTSGHHLSEVAEIHLQFDESLAHIWEQSGNVPEGCSYKGNGLFIIKDTVVNFDGLVVDTTKTYFFSAYAKFFNALPAEDPVMSFDINQFVLAKDDTIFGGNINFTAIYDEDAYMQVVAYEDKSALAGDGIQFTAASTATDAEYVWFNMAGDTIGIGDELNVTASTTQRYYLVGRSDMDEAIGYDSVTVTVRLAAITALTPNPANNQTVVSYRLASEVTSASIVIANATGQVLYSAPLDVTQTTHTVNLQAIPTGQYTVRIESQGSPLDSKTLIVY